jgi:hypothetical protein
MCLLILAFGVWCASDRTPVISYARAVDVTFDNQTRTLRVQWEVRRERDCEGTATRRARGAQVVEVQGDIRIGQPIGRLYHPDPVLVHLPYNIHGIVQYEIDSEYMCRLFVDAFGYRWFLFINPVHRIRPIRFLWPPLRLMVPQHPAVAKRRNEIEMQRFDQVAPRLPHASPPAQPKHRRDQNPHGSDPGFR